MSFAFLFPVLLELLAKSVLIVVVAMGASALLGRISAARRHVLWLAAGGALLLLPLARCVAPLWAVPVGRSLLPPLKVTLTAPPWSPRRAAAETLALTAPGRRNPFLPAETLLALWCAGFAGLLGYRMLGSLSLARLRRRHVSRPAQRLIDLTRQIAGSLGLRRRVTVLWSTSINTPLTWGTWHPVVLLPAPQGEGWTDAQLAAVLRHELGHIARYDHLTRSWSSLVCAFYWPNPLVWLAARELRATQETACDDLVLRDGTSASDYAALLLETARLFHPKLSPLATAAVPMAPPSRLRKRVLAVVDGNLDRRPAGRWAFCLGAGVVCVLVAVSALAQVSAPVSSPEGSASAATVVPDQAGEQPRIDVACQFIELPVGILPSRPSSTLTLPDGETAVAPTFFSAAEWKELTARSLSKEGVDRIATPRIYVHSGQKATIEFPASWPLPDSRFPAGFAGYSLGVTPKLLSDGRINPGLELRVSSPPDDPTAKGLPLMVREHLYTITSTIHPGEVVLLQIPSPSGDQGRELAVAIRVQRMEAGISIPGFADDEASRATP